MADLPRVRQYILLNFGFNISVVVQLGLGFVKFGDFLVNECKLC